MTVRILLALAVLVSAYIHLKLWLDTMRDVHLVGPAFLVNVVAGVAIAGLLIVWRRWLAPLLAAGFGAATLGGLVIAATVDLFGYHEPWRGPYVWTSAAVETFAIVLGTYAAIRELRQSRREVSPVASVAGQGRRLRAG
jgi:hypothetical protein